MKEIYKIAKQRETKGNIVQITVVKGKDGPKSSYRGQKSKG